VLDLRSARAGQRLFPLTPEQVRAPFGVEIVQVTPSAIAFAFEPSATRTVPVELSVEGRPAPGYVVGSMTSEPALVEIVGPESAVKRATEALAEPVAIGGARERVREMVTVGVLDPSLRLKSARSAIVTIDIQPAPLERTLHNQPLHLSNLGANLVAQADPATVNVSLRGSRDALARLQSDDVRAFVDVAGLGTGQYPLTVYADVKRDAGVTRIEPPVVQVRISRGKERSNRPEIVRHRRRPRCRRPLPARSRHRPPAGRGARARDDVGRRAIELGDAATAAGGPRHARIGRVDRARAGARRAR
jgi:hypothetical protein